MDQLRVPRTPIACSAGPRCTLVAIAAWLVSAWACGSSPMAPKPPVETLRVSCPANVSIQGAAGQPVTFTAPVATGGAAPVSVACTPASGTPFGAGTTPVACTATDAAGQSASCMFTVTVTVPIALSVSKFVAYGDSVTWGENGIPALYFRDEPNAYPTKLQALLQSTYVGQDITVPNLGWPGERVEDAKARLPGVLSQERPGALLVIDGYNNLLADCAFAGGVTPACATAIDFVVGTLREIVRIARQPAYQVGYVFVGTLTPPGSTVSGASDRRISPGAITRLNAGIQRMMPGEGAIVVDLYPLFLGHEAQYVAPDGLHLLPPGNEAIAQAFFSAIERHVPRSPASGVFPGAR